ncbi:hypothetical protein PRIPAC_81173, partial [Pristionchus pacificus]|uniref:Uncharacterized protein n=1 Tax=Pristionchus pacificus TaxID=54126 RepID=A0A2A6BVE0_PRIPA
NCKKNIMRRDKSPCSIVLHNAQHSIPSRTRVVNRKKIIQLFVASFVLVLLWRYYVKSTTVKELCTYVDDDLVAVSSGQQCAETQKVVPPAQAHLSNSVTTNFDIDFTSAESATDEFDYSVCPPLSTLKVYVPRHDHPLAKALSLHPAATTDQRDACLDIEFADGDKSVYSRSRNVSNLLIINLDPSRAVTAEGAVMLAQDNYEKGAFRSSLEFAVHTSVAEFDIDGWKSEPSILPVSRENFAVYLTTASGRTDNSSSRAIHTVSCSGGKCEANLTHYSFCLISPSEHFQSNLLLVLRSGCIPIVLSRTQPLPFQDHLDWRMVALRYPALSLEVLLEKLEMIPKEDILEMRRRGIIFRRRLDNAHALARTLLAAVAEVLQLQLPAAPLLPTRPLFHHFESNGTYLEGTRKEYRRIASPLNRHLMATTEQYSYDRWNSGRDLTFTPRVLYDAVDLPAEAEYYADSEIVRTAGSRNRQVFGRGLGLNREPEQFTVVMMTYNRDDGVREIIHRLNNCPHMNKMIIVWNNIGRLPGGNDWPKIHVPIEFIRSERNSVNNRFLPFDRIETEAIFFIDDEMDVVHEELVYAFKVWRQNRDRIVGFFDRYHSWSGETSKYGKARSCEYSMMIGAFLVAHKEFFYEYSYNMHPAIRAMVDEVTNCDDLAFNYHVSHLTRKPPMKVQKLVGNWNSKTIRGLSARGNHFTVRDECMQKMNAIYGYNPLMLSQVKAMPSIGVCVPGMH